MAFPFYSLKINSEKEVLINVLFISEINKTSVIMNNGNLYPMYVDKQNLKPFEDEYVKLIQFINNYYGAPV